MSLNRSFTGIERWSLRLRIFLFFALIAAGSALAIAAALVYLSRGGAAPDLDRLVLAGLGLIGATTGLTLWVWIKFDDHVARPLTSLGANLRASVHAGATHELPETTGRYLGLLAPAMREASAALAEAQRDTDAIVARATADAERQRARLEAVLRDLQQGVVICTLTHKVLLYNRFAQTLLDQDGAAGRLGLERHLTGLIVAQPLRHGLDRLTRRFASGRHRTHREGLSAPFVSATASGRDSLRGRMSLILDAEETAPIGYVVTFDRITDELAAGIWRDRLLHDVTQDMRQRVASLSLAAQVLLRRAKLPPEDNARLAGTVAEETQVLAERLDRLDQVTGDLLAGAWPMTDVFSATLVDCTAARRSEGRALAVAPVGEEVWLACDSASVVELMDRLLNRVAVHAEVSAFDLGVHRDDGRCYLDLAWTGALVPVETLEGWLDEPLDESLGAMSGRDVLSRHKTEIWSDRTPDGKARIRLPLTSAADHVDRPEKSPTPIPERPEFYDFDLFARETPASIEDAPLRTLSYVVFDTETTGLEPSRGDEMISIAGVRIVNGRVLRGEVFNAFVHPGRRIPVASTRVHGITDAMVAEAPPLETVVPEFHRFVADSVLVAHNAAFDMTFLAKDRSRTGVAFDQPVLDTVLLAGHIFGTAESLTLDALAERFQIAIPPEDRHTALGDALATAEVLRKLIGLLEPLGVTTLGQAIEVSNRQVALRRRQKGY
ncbi:exonuclease domain-containing protein [Stappia sp.]|uniref:3'-5' exonuclease n=1 Tax=Stappia sp. TaxID=1870903 RepID=UPI0032D8B59D